MNTIQTEAAALVQKHKESIDYFTKFGTPLEKAVVEAVLSLVEAK